MRKRTRIGRISGSLLVVITVVVGLGLGAGCVILTACQSRGPESQVLVEWTTESEVETAGFNLYRSESPAGPYLKVNPALIPGSSDPLLGGRYVYTDTNVVAGRTYYYKLEDVELDGATTLHGPIEVVAEAAHPSVFSNLAAWWPLAVLVAVLVLSGVVALRWRGQRA